MQYRQLGKTGTQAAERARLYGFLAESVKTHVSGMGVPADVVLAERRGASFIRP